MSGEAFCLSFQNLLSSRSLSKNIKIQRTKIFPVVLYGCEAWSLTLREEHRMKGFVTRILREIFAPKMEQVGV